MIAGIKAAAKSLDVLGGLTTFNEVALTVESYVGLDSTNKRARTTLVSLEGGIEFGAEGFKGHGKATLSIEKTSLNSTSALIT